MKTLFTFFVFGLILFFSGWAQPTHEKISEKFDNRYSEYLNENIHFGKENISLFQKPTSKTKSTDWYEPDTIYYIDIRGHVDLRDILLYKNGQLAIRLYQSGSSVNGWTGYRKDSYSYDRQNNLKEIIIRILHGEQWVNAGKYNYSYDSNSNGISFLEQSWVSEQWENSFQLIFTYDSHNNQTSETAQYWEFGIWNDAWKVTYAYDTRNNLTEIVYMHWDFYLEQWDDPSKYIYLFDENNNVIEELYQRWYNEQWTNRVREIYTYNIQNKKTSKIRQDCSSSGNWFNVFKSTYNYDINNNMIEELFQRWKSEQWEIDGRDIYTYDDQNNMASHIIQGWDSENWKNCEKFTYSFDDHHNTTECFYQIWYNDEWFDANIWPTTLNYIYYNNNQSSIFWNGIHKIAVSYIKIGTVSIQENPAIENSIKLYPNPVSNILHIETSNSNTLPEVKIYSIYGVLLLYTKGNQIDVSSLSNGIYIVDINGVCRKIVKQ
jgi:hypothetical protein